MKTNRQIGATFCKGHINSPLFTGVIPIGDSEGFDAATVIV